MLGGEDEENKALGLALLEGCDKNHLPLHLLFLEGLLIVYITTSLGNIFPLYHTKEVHISIV